MAVSATLVSQLTVEETLETNVPAAAGAKVTHDDFNSTKRLKASGGDVVGTKVAAINPALSAGAYTIDLTALTGTNGAALDGTGLKVKAVKFLNPTGNGTMVFTVGGSNPYLFAADSAWKISLKAGDEVLLYFGDNNAAVGGSAKNIAVSGTGTQSFKAIFVLGT